MSPHIPPPAAELAAVLGHLADEAGKWQEQALCAQVDPDAWYPEKGETAKTAKNICARCPVRAKCLSTAMAQDERFGVWGGLSERERRAIRRGQRPAALHVAQVA